MTCEETENLQDQKQLVVNKSIESALQQKNRNYYSFLKAKGCDNTVRMVFF